MCSAVLLSTGGGFEANGGERVSQSDLDMADRGKRRARVRESGRDAEGNSIATTDRIEAGSHSALNDIENA